MLTPAQVHAAILHALSEYGADVMGQAWLKPTCVHLIDHLVPHLQPASPPFLCVNGMHSERAGAAWDWRREMSCDTGSCRPAHMTLYRHECLVDMNLMIGADDPYETILTAESEGYPGHGQTVGQVVHAAENDFLWDFYKLLMVPSPVRIMFTLCSPDYQPDLIRRLNQLVNRYSILASHLAPTSDIWSVSFPTGSMRRSRVRVERWAPGGHGHAAQNHALQVP